MTGRNRTIVIVGGGFSGIMLATNLLRQPAPRPLRIVLVERGAQLAGPAYAARDYPYLLNVPAGRMSAQRSAPDSFLQFARRRAPATGAEDFVPRAWFGDYLRELLAEAEATAGGARLQRLRAAVTGLARLEGRAGLQVTLADGRVLRADHVVLACGNPPPAQLPALAGIHGHPGHVPDACRDEASPRMHGEVLLIGTGLTMADAALAATARGATRVLAISRHGLVPAAQLAGTHAQRHPQVEARLAAAGSLRELMHAARALVDQAAASGTDWRDIVNAIREQAPVIWQGLDERQRRQFLRHVRPYWDVHRHRLPPNTFEKLEVLRGSGRLQVHAGRILAAVPDEARLRVTWLPRGAAAPRQFTVDHVFNCTGPDHDLRRSQDPLFRAAIRDGLVVPDACGLGLRTGAHGALVDAQGEPSRELFCLGPMLRADHWEATAVAELRVHAEQLAVHLGGTATQRTARDTGAEWLQAGHMPTGMVKAAHRHFWRESSNATLVP